MADNKLQRVPPLQSVVPIVDKYGKPTVQFLRLFNQHFPNVQVTYGVATGAAALAGAAQPGDNDLTALAGLSGTGIACRTAADTWAVRTLSPPAAGLSISNPAGVAGNPTFALANDLAALEGLSGMHTIYYRSAADTWSAVTIGTGLDFTGATLSCTVTGGTGTVTTTGSPASGNLAKFSGATSIVNGDLSGDVTTSGTLATTIANNAVTTAKINNSAVTLAKIANAAASSKLVGSGASGSGSAYAEISLGTGLSMSGTTLNASGGGSYSGARVKKASDQIGANYSTTSPVVWDTEVEDIGGWHHFTSTVTITIASPGVVSWTAHGFNNGNAISFSTTGALPTGLTAGTTYYIVSAATDTFQVSATPGGSAINTSGSQSGTHTATNDSVFRVPTGVTRIECGAAIRLANFSTTAAITFVFAKNGTATFDEVAGQNYVTGVTVPRTCIFSGPMVVTPGDNLEVLLGSGADTSVDITAAISSFWIRAIG
jgi:hypothetical protein